MAYVEQEKPAVAGCTGSARELEPQHQVWIHVKALYLSQEDPHQITGQGIFYHSH